MTLLPDAVAAIESYAWPGNVRELENVMRRAVIMADGSGISAADIGIAPEMQRKIQLNLRQVRDEAEKHAVLRVLGRVNGNLSKAADLLGVSRPTLYELIHRFGLNEVLRDARNTFDEGGIKNESTLGPQSGEIHVCIGRLCPARCVREGIPRSAGQVRAELLAKGDAGAAVIQLRNALQKTPDNSNT